MLRKKLVTTSSFLLLLFFSCTSQQSGSSDIAYLISWNDGAAKTAVINFVKEVTNENDPNYIPADDRIAVFDNDGTLWSEKPMYFQLFFTIDRVRSLADQHPEWKDKQPFKSVLENDMETLFSFGEHGLIELVMATHAGMTTVEFEHIVKEWIAIAKHPRFDRPFTDLVYQPMLELLEFLRANGFKTYIVSGGGIEFMRPLTETLYGIPTEQVIGSSIKVKFEMRDDEPVLVRQPELEFIDDKAEKPVGIHKFIGKKPVAAFGNSDGDLQMLQWTASGKGKRLMLYVHHNDAEREWAYDRDSSVGRLDKGLDEAIEKGWIVVDMKQD